MYLTQSLMLLFKILTAGKMLTSESQRQLLTYLHLPECLPILQRLRIGGVFGEHLSGPLDMREVGTEKIIFVIFSARHVFAN